MTKKFQDSSSDEEDEDDRSVRFNKTAEIRSLPDSTSESIARMSHQNALRARQGRRILRSTQKVTHVAKVSNKSKLEIDDL